MYGLFIIVYLVGLNNLNLKTSSFPWEAGTQSNKNLLCITGFLGHAGNDENGDLIFGLNNFYECLI
jgi:hypothetical protein